MTSNATKQFITMGRAVLGILLCIILCGHGVPADAGYANSSGYYLGASARYVCIVLNGEVSIEDAETGDVLGKIQLPRGAKPFGNAFEPNSKKLYVTDNAASKIYFINNNTFRKTIAAPGPLGPIAMDPKGRFAYASGSSGVVVLNTKSNSIVKTIQVDYPGSLAITPDGNRAYVSIDGNYGSLSQVKVIDTSINAVVATIQLPVRTAPLGVVMHPTGKRLYVAGWVARNVTIIDSDTVSPTYNQVIGTIAVSGNARGIALNPSGSLCYVALDTGGVDAIVTSPSSAQYHTVVQHIPDAGASGGIHEVAFAIDGKTAHVSVADQGRKEIFVIDSDPLSDTFNLVVRVDATGEGPLGMAFTPLN